MASRWADFLPSLYHLTPVPYSPHQRPATPPQEAACGAGEPAPLQTAQRGNVLAETAQIN